MAVTVNGLSLTPKKKSLYDLFDDPVTREAEPEVSKKDAELSVED